MFDGEDEIALHAMQGKRTSSRSEGKVLGFFPFPAGTWGIFLSYDRDGPTKLLFVQ